MTPQNIRQFLPSKVALDRAADGFSSLGFETKELADTHITIQGTIEQFEKAFKVAITPKLAPLFDSLPARGAAKNRLKKTAAGSPKDAVAHQVYFKASRQPSIPSMLSEVVEAIEFPGPVTLFAGVRPVPPSSSYAHLKVPDDVARLMDAARAHAQGITGKGIRIAIVDTGFMSQPIHPYYQNKGYDIQATVADPADPKPHQDRTGHGTAIAACALAVAPGATIIPVKLYPEWTPRRPVFSPNCFSAFKRAVEQNPHIISCSWGTSFSIPFKMAILAALAKGITVVFACGNRRIDGKAPVGWPSSEPSVISVGGAYFADDGSLHASDFAASGMNRNNPGRQCPDVCGLCGRSPFGVYIALPTQPLSLIDMIFCIADRTMPNDGWIVGSGTSSAAPMIAGAIALMLQKDRSLIGNQHAVLARLAKSCLDVTVGRSGSGESAGQGKDLATGHGLAQGYAAVS